MFVFFKINESAPGAGRDVITDFEAGIDTIRLAGIDANILLNGDQAFAFIGSAAFSQTAGELRYANGFVRGDVDGDGAADFVIELSGAPVLTAGDFVL